MAAIVTKATLALKNSLPLIAKDEGKEEFYGRFETRTTHTDMVLCTHKICTHY